MIGKIPYILLFLILVATCSAFPIVGACLLLLSSTLETWNMQISGTQWMFSDIFLIIFLGANVLRLVLLPRIAIDKKLMIPLLLFSCSVLGSCLFSYRPFAAFQELIRLAAYLAAAYFVGFSIKRKHFYIIYLMLAAVTGLSVIFSCFQYYQNYAADSLHVHGGFIDWNYYAIALTFILPFFLAMLHKSKDQKQEYFRIILFYFIVVLIWLIQSRSGVMLLVMLLILSIVMGLLQKKHLVWILPLLLIGLIHLLTGHGGIGEKFQQWMTGPRLQERISHILYALNEFVNHPFLGVGAGQFETYMQWKYPDLGYAASNVDATFPLLLVETGLLGCLSFFYLVCMMLNSIFNANGANIEPDYNKRALMLACTMIAVSSLVFCIHNHLFTWCMIGVIYGLSSKEIHNESI
jgi:O-antigen ligase/polysaccharide polymerase Wzy-like membrane protein